MGKIKVLKQNFVYLSDCICGSVQLYTSMNLRNHKNCRILRGNWKMPEPLVAIVNQLPETELLTLVC